MAARTKSYVTPKYKTRYRVNNWPAYEGRWCIIRRVLRSGPVVRHFSVRAVVAGVLEIGHVAVTASPTLAWV